MNHTQHRRGRVLVAMPGHALALAMRESPQDRAAAKHMASLARLVTIKPETRMLALAGLLPIREG